jgi:hypothetical protein
VAGLNNDILGHIGAVSLIAAKVESAMSAQQVTTRAIKRQANLALIGTIDLRSEVEKAASSSDHSSELAGLVAANAASLVSKSFGLGSAAEAFLVELRLS